MSIVTWNDLYHQLWIQAAQSRGTITSVGEMPGSTCYSTIPEWPRTTGADAIAIASLVDPILGALPLRPGGYGITRLWQTAVIELEGLAFAQPAAEYAHNRALWSTLLAVASYLDTMDAPLPSEDAWEALLDTQWAPTVGHRNAGGPPTRVITESTIEQMWDSQHAELIKARGFDVREPPPNAVGRPMQVPRTTNADVLRLTEYWSKQFVKLQVKVMVGGVANTMGFEGEQARWQAATADVAKYAKPGKPDDVYPKNHELWRAMLSLATTLAVLDEAPAPFDLMVDATKQAVSDLPGRIADAAGTVAHAIGNIAHEAGAGLLSGMGKPLLIGGGVVLGLVLLLRKGRKREAA
jgi:hypothetical protein